MCKGISGRKILKGQVLNRAFWADFFSKTLLTEFGIYHRLEKCVAFLEAKIAQKVAFLVQKERYFLILQHKIKLMAIFFSVRGVGDFSANAELITLPCNKETCALQTTSNSS